MPGKKQSNGKDAKDKDAKRAPAKAPQAKRAPDKVAQVKAAPVKAAPDTHGHEQHGHDRPALSEDEIKAIAERRAESLKRIQEQNAKNATKHFDDSKAGGRGPKGGGPPKARSFRHQGR